MFCSLQGEGIFAGTPCIFLRLSTCNLKCSWCDTKYTWDWENYDRDREVKEISIEEIVNKILGFSHINHVVITGGEPLLQQDRLVLLLKLLKSKGKKESRFSFHHVEIETNGTIIPINEIIDYVDQWNISPKTSNSNNKERGINLERFYEKSLSF